MAPAHTTQWRTALLGTAGCFWHFWHFWHKGTFSSQSGVALRLPPHSILWLARAVTMHGVRWQSEERTPTPLWLGDGYSWPLHTPHSGGRNSANHLVWVEWPSKFDSLNGRDGRPRPSHLSAGWRCEWRELDSLKSKRLAIRFLRVLSGRKASHGAARPPRPTISGNPACSTLRGFRGQTLSCEDRRGC
jgi:hypothetical protein